MPHDQPDGRRTATRDRLIRSAVEQFRRRGVGAVGVAEVCAGAGVGKGVFAHHFPGGKAELVAAATAANGADVRALLAHRTASDRPLPELVRGFFAGYARLMRERGTDYGCPVAAGVVDASALSAQARRAADEAFSSWSAQLARRCPDDVAELVIATLEGAILLARAADDPAVLDRTGSTLAGLLAAPTA
ncbi:TetR/AcrR family transcriptional regulator [Pseudonocardia lacus]|uniref:TetR/AcrR family transcriptional regulator n=1 Tax=Pseudonocardia lacus TaxID=2835865 RepID=UPI001BDBF2AC|nr:TetR/AcrR family transcriptional regulator [Pseudonocardia lacus]